MPMGTKCRVRVNKSHPGRLVGTPEVFQKADGIAAAPRSGTSVDVLCCSGSRPLVALFPPGGGPREVVCYLGVELPK